MPVWQVLVRLRGKELAVVNKGEWPQKNKKKGLVVSLEGKI